MDTTIDDVPMITEALRGMVELLASGVLQTEETRAEAVSEGEWLYSRLLWYGQTPAEIEAAVPGTEAVL